MAAVLALTAAGVGGRVFAAAAAVALLLYYFINQLEGHVRFLPLIAGLIVALTGDPYAGLWYAWIIVAVAFLVALWGLPSGPPRDFADDAA